MQVVGLCARSVLTPDEAMHLKHLLGASIDWPHLVDRARFHGVMGMLYHHLAQHAETAVPPAVRAEMQEATQAVQFHNLQMMQELVRLAGRFDRAGVPLLSFKGPLLAHQYYGNLAFRRFGDVDLLVRPADRPAAVRLLEEAGYTDLRGLSGAEAQAFHREHLGAEFGHAEKGVVAELHVGLLNRTLTFRLEPEAVWKRAQPRHVGGHRIYDLAPADLLLYLCAHGTKHHWSRLLWTCDVAQVLRQHPGLLTDDLLASARRIGSLRTLLLGLRLAERWLGADLPVVVHRELEADTVVAALVQEIETTWLGTEQGLKRDAGWDTFWFAVRTRQRLRDNRSMIAHYLRLAVTPTENDRAFAGPGVPDSLLYLLRPLRLLTEPFRRSPAER